MAGYGAEPLSRPVQHLPESGGVESRHAKSSEPADRDSQHEWDRSRCDRNICGREAAQNKSAEAHECTAGVAPGPLSQ